MQTLAEPVSKLIEAFCQLPGIGPKTASRLAYFLLRSDENIALNLAKALEEMKANTLFCSVCFNIADRDPCPVCTNQQRDHGLICIVEEPLDVQAIERTREFSGRYHVLGGALSPIDGIGPDQLRVRELMERIDAGGVQEVILATNPNASGEATASFLTRGLDGRGLRVTRLASGLPVGGDLDYAYEVTLSRAFAGRREA
jgi:recombination protein RecR